MPFPARLFSLISAGGGGIMFFVGTQLLTYENTRSFALFASIFGAYVVLYNLAMAFSRIQVFENGLWVYLELIQWGKIEFYEWKDDSQKLNSLKLRFKGSLPSFLRNGVLPVPQEKRNQFDVFLNQYLVDRVKVEM